MVPCTIVPIVDGSVSGRMRFWGIALTSLELDCHSLIRALHQKPTMPVSQAPLVAAFRGLVQHAPGLLCGLDGWLT